MHGNNNIIGIVKVSSPGVLPADTPSVVLENDRRSPSLRGNYHSGILDTWISLTLLRNHWGGHALSFGVWAGWP